VQAVAAPEDGGRARGLWASMITGDTGSEAGSSSKGGAARVRDLDDVRCMPVDEELLDLDSASVVATGQKLSRQNSELPRQGSLGLAVGGGGGPESVLTTADPEGGLKLSVTIPGGATKRMTVRGGGP
jgi:hypothetical protein